jgi:hypothetical protein
VLPLVQVKYDVLFSYPTSVYIDRDEMMADEEISYTAGNYTKL